MLQDGRMAGLVKPHRSARPRGERQVRAVRVGGVAIDTKGGLPTFAAGANKNMGPKESGR